MSRLTGNDAKNLREAYASVYAPQEEVELTEEQVWEEVENWVNSLLEEGHDLSEYTWEELYETYNYFVEQGGVTANVGGVKVGVTDPKTDIGARSWNFIRNIPTALSNLGRSTSVAKPSPSTGMVQAKKGGVPGVVNKATGEWKSAESITGVRVPSARNLGQGFRMPAAGSSFNASGMGGDRRGASAGPVAAQKPAVPAAAKPTTSAAPKGDAMDQWAKANPRLAAAAAERARTRGTSATTNPLMKDMASRLPAPKPVATPTPTSTPAVKAVTPTAAVSAAPSTSPAASGSLAPATAKIAAKPSSAMSQDSIRARRLNMEMEYDAFDLVLEYLTSEGHVDTVDEALYVMMEMDPETIQSICEAKKSKKWIQKAIKHPGALSKELGVPEEENIPAGKLEKAAKAKGKMGQRARLAMTLKGLKKE